MEVRQVLRSSSVLLHEYGVKEENHLSASLSPLVLGIQIFIGINIFLFIHE